MKRKVLIGPSTFASLDPAPREKMEQTGFEIISNPFGRKFTKAELIKNLARVSGLIAGLETLDGEVLRKSALKVISRCGSGLDNIDLETARELDIRVYSTPDAPTAAVAELTIGAMLCLLRHISRMDRELHEGRWVKLTGAQLGGKTVAIIGFGRIGRLVAKLLKPFDVKMLAVDPNIMSEDAAKEDAELVGLGDAIKRADIITIHVSGDKKIMGEKEFGLMKRGVFILNSARGAALDESALVDALESGQVAGLWCDAFQKEPYDGLLKKYNQVILTPHVGSYSRECRLKMEMEAADNLVKGFKDLDTEVG